MSPNFPCNSILKDNMKCTTNIIMTHTFINIYYRSKSKNEKRRTFYDTLRVEEYRQKIYKYVQ